MALAQTIEDDARDILAKAAKGREMDAAGLAAAAGVPLSIVQAALGKNAYPPMAAIPDAAWRAMASACALHPDALLDIARGRYRPQVISPPWLVRVVSRYRHIEVNAWILANPANRQAVLIDTGGDARALIGCLARNQWQAQALLLTHDHADHIAGLPELRSALPGLPVFSPELDPVPGTTPVRPGAILEPAGLSIRALPTPGHTDGGLSYLVSSTTPPVCFVGDALFAGSIGGARHSYADALHFLREQVFSLAPDTLLCPGHGPLTTLALESRHNPFFVTTT